MTSMLQTTMQDAARPLARFAERMGGAYSFNNLAIRYGETSVAVRFPPVRPQNFRELLSAEFLADGWTYTSILDIRGIRRGSVVGLRFSHPITVSRVGTEPQDRPDAITITLKMPDKTVPLTPEVHDRLVNEAAAVASTLLYNQYLREEYDATERRSRLDKIQKRHRHGLALLDPTHFQMADPLKPLPAELVDGDEAPEVECP